MEKSYTPETYIMDREQRVTDTRNLAAKMRFARTTERQARELLEQHPEYAKKANLLKTLQKEERTYLFREDLTASTRKQVEEHPMHTSIVQAQAEAMQARAEAHRLFLTVSAYYIKPTTGENSGGTILEMPTGTLDSIAS